MKNNIEELRQQMFETIALLKEGKIPVESARAVAELGKVVVDTAKVEVDFLRVVTDPEHRKAAGSGFIPANAGTLELPISNTKQAE